MSQEKYAVACWRKYELIPAKDMNYRTTPKIATGHAICVLCGQLYHL